MLLFFYYSNIYLESQLEDPIITTISKIQIV